MLRLSRMTNVIMAITLLWAASRPTHLSAAPVNLPDVPLVVSTSVAPNVMLLVDNSGSMHNIVPDAPYVATTTYFACPSANAINPASGSIDLLVRVGEVPYFRQSGTLYNWGTSGGAGTRGANKCFDPTLKYDARLYPDSGTAPSQPGSYLGSVYWGNYMNWYLGSSPWTDGVRLKSGTNRRITIAQGAAKQLVDSLGSVRLGLATYNSDNGGTISVGVKATDTLQKTTLKTAIDLLVPTGMTPLAESLQDIGRYFVQGFNNTLTLHPGHPTLETTKSAYTVFDHTPLYLAGVLQESPIQYFCQKNFAILVTDGRPQGDRNISSTCGLQDYSGDCPNGNDGITCLDYGRKVGHSYESLGSDYLDDVAMALYDMDLRPDLNDFAGDPVKNNMSTYTISFADEQALHDPLLQSTADKGHGLFLVAENAAQLTSAFQAAVIDIQKRISSTASVALNSGARHANSRVYQARFNSANWSGELLSFPINAVGAILPEEWNAGPLLASQNYDTGREILTFNPSTNVGIPFRWGDLHTSQQTFLHTNASGTVDSQGAARLEYLRGSTTHEGTGNNYRPRLIRLGDLVNSDPFFVGPPDFPDSLGSGYSSFRIYYKTRTSMVYVGSNDGMLHAFDASNGSEKLAYVPNKVVANLSQLTSPDYLHQYYVDGSPNVGNVYGNFGTPCPSTSPCWRSILVSGLRKGGQGLFALDVTDPSTFDESNAAKLVLWEFTDAHDADLGYTFSQPSIVKMANGRWAAVFGNGYNNTNADGYVSTTGHAVLYIVFLDGFTDGTWTAGTDFIKLDTGVGTTTTPNSLSTPAVVDLDGDSTAELIYAGDLEGNVWRFDVRDTNPSNWGTPVRLFTGTSTQPITSRLEVGSHPEGLPDNSSIMIYFGTGKYLEMTDVSSTATQTFYALWDTLEVSPALITRSNLAAQTVLLESGGRRVTSSNPVDWAMQRGWYFDLPTTGERQVSDSILRNQRIIFTTTIPDGRVCSFAGTSWLMELNALDGNRLERPPFDLNNDQKFTDADKVSVIISGTTELVAVSGVQSTQGILPSPTILSSGDIEFKYNSGSAGGIFTTTEDPGLSARGRQAWRQFQ